MPLTCNIDARGKRVRLLAGIGFMVAGVVLALVWAMRSESALGWIVAGAMFVVGGFSIFEARAGWCAVRAMGFRTRV